MPHPTLASNTRDLEQIILLQKENLEVHLDESQILSQGFVTLQHDIATLEKMHALAPSVIIRENDSVVAYALTMLPECRQLIPKLEPMFSLLEEVDWNGRFLRDCAFYVMGQVCIAKPYRGRGLFELLYNHHKAVYSDRYELLITEIATRNTRSMHAHQRVGFELIHQHRDTTDEWAIVGWNWKRSR